MRVVCKITEDGKLEIPPYLKDRYLKLYRTSQTRYGGFVMVWMRTPERTKTTGQNNKFHALNQEIALWLGWEAEDCKVYIKELAYGSFGYPPELNDDGDIVHDPWGKVKGLSVAKASTEDMSKLIEAAYYLAAREGVELYEMEYEKTHGIGL